MYDKGEYSTKIFPSPEGGLRTIRKTKLEENSGILKNPLHTLHKRDPKGTTYVGFFLQSESDAKMILFKGLVVHYYYCYSDIQKGLLPNSPKNFKSESNLF